MQILPPNGDYTRSPKETLGVMRYREDETAASGRREKVARRAAQVK